MGVTESIGCEVPPPDSTLATILGDESILSLSSMVTSQILQKIALGSPLLLSVPSGLF